jgi:hypothetical protein
MSRRRRAMRWAGPLLTEASGDVDVQYVWRLLREHMSNDREFVTKAADVVGLYVQGFLCVDEKPSTEERTRPNRSEP